MSPERERKWSLALWAAAVLVFVAQLPIPVTAAPVVRGPLCRRCWPSTPPTCVWVAGYAEDCLIWDDETGWHCQEVGTCP